MEDREEGFDVWGWELVGEGDDEMETMGMGQDKWFVEDSIVHRAMTTKGTLNDLEVAEGGESLERNLVRMDDGQRDMKLRKQGDVWKIHDCRRT